MIHDEDEVVRDATVLGDELIHCICKVVNTLVWCIPDNSSATELRHEFSQQLSSIQTLHRQFENSEPIKNIAIIKLQEHYLQVIEHTIKYYKVQLFESIDMWKMLYSSENLQQFPLVFKFIELCVCVPCSNATVERFFN